MFPNFDTKLFDDADFKEDAVREVIITPILTRLGYHATGTSRVIRSKSLQHPFIFIGTTRKPVTIIPDYTLLHDDEPLFVLDAKAPNIDLMAPANIQQAYSYAIHPEVRAEHFGLCNGRELVVFSISETEPLLRLPFEKFDDDWETIVSFLAPRYLLSPILRRYDPDAGTAMRRMGILPSTLMSFIGARLNLVAKVSDEEYTAATAMGIGDRLHAVSFDFTAAQLPDLVAGLPDGLRQEFVNALSRAPFKAMAGLCIEVDLDCHLGPEIELEAETFSPLVGDNYLGRLTTTNLAG